MAIVIILVVLVCFAGVLEIIACSVSGPLKISVPIDRLESVLKESQLEDGCYLQTRQAFFARLWSPLSSWKYYDTFGGRTRIPRWHPLHRRLQAKYRELKRAAR